MVKLVSIDSSTTASGFSLYKNGKLSSHKTIISVKTNEYPKYFDMCSKLIEELKNVKPDILVIETPVVIRNAQTQRELAIVYGAVIGYCATNDVEFHSMRPTEWRKYTLEAYPGKQPGRKEWKQWAIDIVNQLYPNEGITDDNEAESILIGLAYINWFNKHATPILEDKNNTKAKKKDQ